MGRNAGSQIHFTHIVVPTDDIHVITWYCQQHSQWKQASNSVVDNAFSKLKTHIKNDHGNVEQ